MSYARAFQIGRPELFKSKREAAAWLSGIIDGEGSVACRAQAKSRGLVREIRITNTDESLLAAVQEVLDMLGVVWRRYDRSERERLGTKPIFDLVITGKANLELVSGYLTLRSVKAETLERMLASWIRPGVPPEAKVREMVASMSDKEIAALYDVTPGAVWSWRRKYGIERVAVVTV